MKQARTLNEAELKLVMAHCATRRHAARERAIVMVSFHLGLRAKEIAALTVGDVRGEDGAEWRWLWENGKFYSQDVFSKTIHFGEPNEIVFQDANKTKENA